MAIPTAAPFAKWGQQRNKTFVIDGVVNVLDGNFAHNFRVTPVYKALQLVFYVDYIKGTETQIELQVSWYPYLDDPALNYFDCVAAAPVAGVSAVTPVTFGMNASGQYRIPLPTFPGETFFQVAVRGDPSPGGPYTGQVQLAYATDNAPLPQYIG